MSFAGRVAEVHQRLVAREPQLLAALDDRDRSVLRLRHARDRDPRGVTVPEQVVLDRVPRHRPFFLHGRYARALLALALRRRVGGARLGRARRRVRYRRQRVSVAVVVLDPEADHVGRGLELSLVDLSVVYLYDRRRRSHFERNEQLSTGFVVAVVHRGVRHRGRLGARVQGYACVLRDVGGQHGVPQLLPQRHAQVETAFSRSRFARRHDSSGQGEALALGQLRFAFVDAVGHLHSHGVVVLDDERPPRETRVRAPFDWFLASGRWRVDDHVQPLVVLADIVVHDFEFDFDALRSGRPYQFLRADGEVDVFGRLPSAALTPVYDASSGFPVEQYAGLRCERYGSGVLVDRQVRERVPTSDPFRVLVPFRGRYEHLVIASQSRVVASFQQVDLCAPCPHRLQDAGCLVEGHFHRLLGLAGAEPQFALAFVLRAYEIRA